MNETPANQPYYFLRTHGEYIRVRFSEVLYIKSERNYLHFFTTRKSFLVLGTIKEIEETFPAEQFVRVNRSCLVGLEHIEQFNYDTVVVEKVKIPIGETFRAGIEKKITVLNFQRFGSSSYVDSANVVLRQGLLS